MNRKSPSVNRKSLPVKRKYQAVKRLKASHLAFILTLR